MSNAQKLILKRKRGSVILWSMLFIVVLCFFLGLLVEWGRLHTAKRDIYWAMQLAQFDAVAQVDPERYAMGELYILENQALDVFSARLQQELGLNEAWVPISNDNIISGQVNVVDFIVYNDLDPTPYTPQGQPVYHPSIYALVKVPLRTVFAGLLGESLTAPVASLVAVTCPEGAYCDYTPDAPDDPGESEKQPE